MPQLHLPARHTDDDLAIAGSLARLLDSGDLYVAWSTDGGAAKPVIPATVHSPEPAGETPGAAGEAALAWRTITIESLAAAPAPRRRGLLARFRARRRP